MSTTATASTSTRASRTSGYPGRGRIAKVEMMTALTESLRDPRSSVRLRAVMNSGTGADVADLDALVAQCAVEPDFFVRDMLTWALTRMPADAVVPVLVTELGRRELQARSQALHTLSKIGDAAAWPAVLEHVTDPEDGVARAAWRAAVILAPAEARTDLARVLTGQLGRGDREIRSSLARSLVALGAEVVEPALEAVRARTAAVGGAGNARREAVLEHVAAIERLLADPGAASELALERARREVALGRTRSAKG